MSQHLAIPPRRVLTNQTIPSSASFLQYKHRKHTNPNPSFANQKIKYPEKDLKKAFRQRIEPKKKQETRSHAYLPLNSTPSEDQTHLHLASVRSRKTNTARITIGRRFPAGEMLTTIAFQTGRKFIISSTLKHSRKPRATCIRGSVPARCFREKYRQRRGIIPLWSLSPWPSPYRFLPDGVSRYSLFAASTPSPTHPTTPAACLPSLVHPRSPFFVTLASNPPPPEAFFLFFLCYPSCPSSSDHFPCTRVPASP